MTNLISLWFNYWRCGHGKVKRYRLAPPPFWHVSPANWTGLSSRFTALAVLFAPSLTFTLLVTLLTLTERRKKAKQPTPVLALQTRRERERAGSESRRSAERTQDNARLSAALLSCVGRDVWCTCVSEPLATRARGGERLGARRRRKRAGKRREFWMPVIRACDRGDRAVACPALSNTCLRTLLCLQTALVCRKWLVLPAPWWRRPTNGYYNRPVSFGFLLFFSASRRAKRHRLVSTDLFY